MINKFKKHIIIFTATILLCVFVIFILNYINSLTTETFINHDNDKTTNIRLSDHNGIKTENFRRNHEYSLLFYLSKDCGTCINKLESIYRINEIYKDFLDIAILWSDEIPNNLIDDKNIPIDINYSISNSVEWDTPTIMLLDKNNKVVFESDNVVDAHNYILELFDDKRDEIIKITNKLIIDTYFSGSKRDDRNIFIYFALEGCPDCESIEKNVLSMKSIQEKAQIFKIMTEKTSGNTYCIDYDKIFKNIYNISWYPSFIAINNNNNYEIIGQMQENDVVRQILNFE